MMETFSNSFHDFCPNIPSFTKIRGVNYRSEPFSYELGLFSLRSRLLKNMMNARVHNEVERLLDIFFQ